MECTENYSFLPHLLRIFMDNYRSTDKSHIYNESYYNERSVIFRFYKNLAVCVTENQRIQPDRVVQLANHLSYNWSCIDGTVTAAKLDYSRISNCLAYLLKNAASHAVLVYTILHKIFHCDPPEAITRLLSSEDDINVLCLGSGTGSDFVGLLSSLYGKHDELPRIAVTAVDKGIGWWELFFQIEEWLRKFSFGKTSKILKEKDIDLFFSRTDLKMSQSWSRGFKSKLMNADLLTMVMFLSEVPKNDQMIILDNIVRSMKPGSILIFIDNPLPSKEFAAVQNFLECVYESTSEKFTIKKIDTEFSLTVDKAFVRIFVRKLVVSEEEK